ncbi:MAG: Vesicular integral-membrane protein VIP36 [Watsoniomyces obsoletus]|nr:MAG: Vesicular integral-membrane protein VIP36 [Watsoniomyces obsoletus]
MDAITNALNPSNGASSLSPKAQLIQKLQYETALNNAKQLVENINAACFDRCVPQPGSNLPKAEETCVTQCMEKYMAAWNTVSKAYIDRIKRESPNSH